MKDLKVTLIDCPTDEDWIGVKRRALITVYGERKIIVPPSSNWKYRILAARHSPIRYLKYSFLVEGIPSNTAVHFCRLFEIHNFEHCRRDVAQTATLT